MKVHFMGIGGAGASACAAIAVSAGFKVSGCDIAKSGYLSKLTKIKIEIGHSKKHLKNCDLLIISPAILKFDPKNFEILEAKSRRIRVLTWQEFMGKFLQKGKRVITVAGTHGKSTTTAMISHILEDTGFDPTVEVGAVDLAWRKNFRVGDSKWFVCEADEYNNNFFNYQPEIAVISNIDWDHPDFFKDEESVFESFVSFIKQNHKLESLFVSPQAVGIKRFLVELFGEKKAAEYLELVKFSEIKFKLKIPGEHNLTNANLAAAVVKRLGVQPLQIKNSLENFFGLERRLEFIGKLGKTKIYDDFAHHPAEIKATFEALTEQSPKASICLIFQPHTYSRTKAFFSDFVSTFKKTNLSKVVFTDIFASREKTDLGISSHDLAAAVGNNAVYVSTLTGVADWISKNFQNFDLIATVGAGDIGKIWDLPQFKVKLKHVRNY